MSKSIVVANWKMNPQSFAEAKQLFNSVKKGIKGIKNAEIVICPPFVYLNRLKTGDYKLHLGSQDLFWEEKGAFTGEISPSMLKDLSCHYVILGHSERRRYFLENDEMINKKIKAAILAKLNAIFCIGETQTEKEQVLTKKILSRQIRKGLKEVSKKEVKKIIIAYEPVWAIGTGMACLPSEVGKVSELIRRVITQIYTKKIAKNIKILYGGSGNSQNAVPYIFEANFHGLLV